MFEASPFASRVRYRSLHISAQFEVVVIGAGAAGLLAATCAAERGRRTLLLEKNRKPAVKILMSGGTRCNLTHAVDSRGIIEAFGKPGRFLHSPLAAFSPDDLVRLMEAEGVPTKTESTGKIFPASDRAADVANALVRRLKRSSATLALDEGVSNIERAEDHFRVRTTKQTIQCEKLIVTTGGQSYPGCGTSGDGYVWLERLGHTIVTPRPALTPVKTRADWAKSLKGVTIPDVGVGVEQTADEVTPKKQQLDQRRGSLLFAHFGMSGPVVLDVSRCIAQHSRPRTLELVCDFLPAEPRESLLERLKTLSTAEGKKQLSVLLTELLPRSLVDALLAVAGLPQDRRAAQLGRHERTAVTQAFKETRIPVTGTLGFEKAEVTAGGVALTEVSSRDLQSKVVPHLFVAGEILDLDGPIGGYNFQAAFSTGFLAGNSV